MPATIELSQIPADVRKKLGVKRPRRQSMTIHEVRTHALRMLHVVADLTKDERSRVLTLAGKLNAIALVLVMVLSSSCASLPRVQATRHDCQLMRSEYDNPIDDRHGFNQPRLAWHLEYAVAAYAVTAVVSNVLPPRWATVATFTAFALVPHTRSILIQQRYPLTTDVLFDAVNRATPFVWLANQDTTRSRWKNVGAWLAADASLECWGSP